MGKKITSKEIFFILGEFINKNMQIKVLLIQNRDNHKITFKRGTNLKI